MFYSDEEKQILNERYENNIWSFEETCFRDRKARRRPKLVNREIPLSLVLETHLKLSVFGRFMHQFNPDQYRSCMVNENKFLLETNDIGEFTKQDLKYWDFYHSFSENLFALLKKSIEEKRHIDLQYFQENLQILRLNNGSINSIDSLRKFVHLKLLTLGANWINIIEGKKLPRDLKMLELFCNQISSLKSFCNKCCKRLKYLGLGRNLLTDGSFCHLLVTSGNFERLKALDLSNNNIQNIREIVRQIDALKNLNSLSLEGNPCYTTESYTEIVLKSFPNLKFLDDMEVLEEDRIFGNNINDNIISGSTKGSFIFTCYKLLGLPNPPKKKGIQHTFHIEVELPFLEEFVRKEIFVEKEVKNKTKMSIMKIKDSVPFDKDINNKKGKKGKKEKPEKQNTKKSSNPSLRRSLGVLRGTGMYAFPDETYSRDKNRFKTEERMFSKSLKFNNPSMIVVPPKNDLTLLRDTFRSRINVNIVYVQKMSPKKEKKSKKNKKTKKTNSIVETLLEPPKPVILKTSTFASFYCDLKNVNWSDSYVDFIWTNNNKFGKKAYCVPGSLKPEIFLDKKKSKNKLPKPSRTVQILVDTPKKEQEIINEFEQLSVPTTLTCLVGFGLWRNGMIEERVVEENKGKKK